MSNKMAEQKILGLLPRQEVETFGVLRRTKFHYRFATAGSDTIQADIEHPSTESSSLPFPRPTLEAVCNGSRPFSRASINRRLVAIGKFRSCVDTIYARRAGRPVVHAQPRGSISAFGMPEGLLTQPARKKTP